MTISAGKPTGEGYVEFSNAKIATEALEARQRAHLGPRYIEVCDDKNILYGFHIWSPYDVQAPNNGCVYLAIPGLIMIFSNTCRFLMLKRQVW